MNEQQPESRYLRVSELGVLRRLRFVPRGKVIGRYAGRHRSDRFGRSVEFADYRQFVPGDTPGDVDWKVYGRSDRLYVKRFEMQTEVSAVLVVDASASMGYAGVAGKKARPRKSWLGGWTSRQRGVGVDDGPVSKYDHAAKLASTMAFMLVQQQDRVGLAIAREGLEAMVEPAGGWRQARAVVSTLEAQEPGAWRQPSRLGEALEAVGRRLRRRRGVVIVLSDLHDESGPVLRGLRLLRHAGHEAAVFHVLHGDELALPNWGQAVVVDSESGRRLRLSEPAVRAAYEQKLADWRRRWASDLRGMGVDYAAATMDRPYLESLRGYLAAR
ncbi:MAG: DUF58 domain-containing protein [Planctomycetota bacterium]